MGTTPQTPQLDETQQNLLQLVQLVGTISAPFIKNPKSQDNAAKIFGTASGVAVVLPTVFQTLGNLYHSIGDLFHHHAVMNQSAPPAK